jgi:hypothetical protein
MKLRIRTKENPSSDQYFNNIPVSELQSNILTPLQQGGAIIIPTTEGRLRSIAISDTIAIDIIIAREDDVDVADLTLKVENICSDTVIKVVPIQ